MSILSATPRAPAVDVVVDDDEIEADKKPRAIPRRRPPEKPATSPATSIAAVAVSLVGAMIGLGIVFMYWKEGAGLERLMGPVLVGGGLFAIMAALLNWEWFMVFWSESASRTLGRTGLRLMYVAIGLAILVVGVLGAMGLVDLRTGRR